MPHLHHTISHPMALDNGSIAYCVFRWFLFTYKICILKIITTSLKTAYKICFRANYGVYSIFFSLLQVCVSEWANMARSRTIYRQNGICCLFTHAYVFLRPKVNDHCAIGRSRSAIVVSFQLMRVNEFMIRCCLAQWHITRHSTHTLLECRLGNDNSSILLLLGIRLVLSDVKSHRQYDGKNSD